MLMCDVLKLKTTMASLKTFAKDLAFPVDFLGGAKVVPRNWIVKYAMEFVDRYIPGGVNPSPAVSPKHPLSTKDIKFMTMVALLPDTDLTTLNNLLNAKNDRQKLADLLDKMYEEFESE